MVYSILFPFLVDIIFQLFVMLKAMQTTSQEYPEPSSDNLKCITLNLNDCGFAVLFSECEDDVWQ